MKHVIRLATVCVLLAVFMAGCDGALTLTDDDNGTSVTLVTGEALELVLTSNPTTGYSWTAVEPGEGTLRLEYTRPWESDEEAPVEIYEIEVTVE